MNGSDWRCTSDYGTETDQHYNTNNVVTLPGQGSSNSALSSAFVSKSKDQGTLQ